jgi:biofilm PGA synthesis N-glycosyltransferase PgaC
VSNAIVVCGFWIALVFIFYTYVGYPIVLYLRTCWRIKPIRKDVTYEPSVSLLIIAHDEEKVIRSKLENAITLQYPQDRYEILVASDGSTDRTNEIVHEFKDRGVLLLAFAARRGKTQTLNEALPHCRGEIVILSDARQLYAPTAVREMVANFRDEQIGAVTGDLQFRAVPDGQDGEHIGLYWAYEKWIRKLQSLTDSTPVVTGAIYAIRRSLFCPLPNACIADDLAMPMNIIMQGRRVIFDAAAKAYDYYSRTLKEEFRKRVRTIAGSYQYVGLVSEVLNPKANRIWFDFVSHKVCRLLVPFALCVLFLTNLVLTAWPFRLFLILQVALYGMAGVGAVWADRGQVPKALLAPYTFLMLNVAASVALFRLVAGTQSHLWEKTKRAL